MTFHVSDRQERNVCLGGSFEEANNQTHSKADTKDDTERERSSVSLESVITARVWPCFDSPGLHPGRSAYLFLCLHPNLGLGLLCAR